MRFLKYHKHNEIDFKKWDQLMLTAEDSLIYCSSWYLDIIHPSWGALIYVKDKEYVAAAPILDQKKWKFLPIHPKPILVQRLGLISTDKSGKAGLQKETINYLMRKFKIYHYPFNDQLPVDISILDQKEHHNYTLNLSGSYQEIYNNYRRDRKARLKQAKAEAIDIVKSNSNTNLLRLFRSDVVPKIYGGVDEATMQKMAKLSNEIIRQDTGFILEASDNMGTVLSASLFVIFKNRITYLFSATSPLGKKLNANTLLLDHVIRQYSNQSLIIDFEGSDVEGIADFYKGFGAKAEIYSSLHHQSSFYNLLSKLRKLI